MDAVAVVRKNQQDKALARKREEEARRDRDRINDAIRAEEMASLANATVQLLIDIAVLHRQLDPNFNEATIIMVRPPRQGWRIQKRRPIVVWLAVVGFNGKPGWVAVDFDGNGYLVAEGKKTLLLSEQALRAMPGSKISTLISELINTRNRLHNMHQARKLVQDSLNP